jgi:hypothetical protein
MNKLLIIVFNFKNIYTNNHNNFKHELNKLNLYYEYYDLSDVFLFSDDNNKIRNILNEINYDLTSKSSMLKNVDKIILFDDMTYINLLLEIFILQNIGNKKKTYLNYIDNNETNQKPINILKRKLINYRNINSIVDINLILNSERRELYELFYPYKKYINHIKFLLKSSNTIQDFYDDMIIENYYFYTKKQMIKLKNVKYKTVSFDIIVNKYNIIIFEKLLSDILNINPIDNGYIINKINIFSLLDIHNIINKQLLENDKVIIKNCDDTSNDNLEVNNLFNIYADRNVSNNKEQLIFWYKLYKYVEKKDFMINKPNAIIIINDKSMREFNDINIIDYLDRFVLKNKIEEVYFYKDNYCFGTSKVVFYYCLLFNYLELYSPLKNKREYLKNEFMYEKKYYTNMKMKQSQLNIQLIEHMLHFFDIVKTSYNYLERKEDERMIYFTDNFINRQKINKTLSQLENYKIVSNNDSSNILDLDKLIYDDKIYFDYFENKINKLDDIIIFFSGNFSIKEPINQENYLILIIILTRCLKKMNIKFKIQTDNRNILREDIYMKIQSTHNLVIEYNNVIPQNKYIITNSNKHIIKRLLENNNYLILFEHNHVMDELNIEYEKILFKNKEQFEKKIKVFFLKIKNKIINYDNFLLKNQKIVIENSFLKYIFDNF